MEETDSLDKQEAIEQGYKEWLRSMKPTISNDQLIKDEEEFSSLIVQLGHSVVRKVDTGLHYIFMKSMNLIVARDFYLYRTPGDIIDEIDRHIGHKHVMCKECHQILLQHDADKLLSQIASIIEDAGVVNKVYGRKLEYKVTSEGPRSEPITVCPQCGSMLNEDSIREIADE